MSRHFDEADGLCESPDPVTQGNVFNHTMVRIREPRRSLDFYTRGLGMRLIRRIDFAEAKFTLYFLGMVDPQEAKEIPTDDRERAAWTFSRPAMLELTHNWGDETRDVQFHSGNEEPKGYGHIGITVPDLAAACAHLDSMGTDFVKRPEEGRMSGIAFVRDPDGYWIELIEARQLTRGL